jgi:cell fate (sporulation/competence/biofilm development) regulator YmcA (YheA/YmcA/DUF963 family)
VLDKIAYTEFKEGINAKATISNVFDMLMAKQDVSINYQLITGSEAITKEHVCTKSLVDQGLRMSTL